jgi:hypothetical protein
MGKYAAKTGLHNLNHYWSLALIKEPVYMISKALKFAYYAKSAPKMPYAFKVFTNPVKNAFFLVEMEEEMKRSGVDSRAISDSTYFNMEKKVRAKISNLTEEEIYSKIGDDTSNR